MRSYKLKITPEAFQEIQKAIDYYKIRSKGLGKRFYLDLQAQFTLIKRIPSPAPSAMMTFVSPSWIDSPMPPISPSTKKPAPSSFKQSYPTTKIPRPIGKKDSSRAENQ